MSSFMEVQHVRRSGRKLSFGLLLVLVTVAFLVAFQGSYAHAKEPGPVDVERLAPNQMPEEVAQWVESIKETQGLHRFDHGDKTYVVVAWGPKSTGGYSVTIENAERNEFGVVVLSVKLNAPGPNDIVTQAFTYPYDLVAIEQTDEPFAAEFGGHPTPWLPKKQEGVPLVSEHVFLQEPLAGTKLDQTLKLKGAAQLFEGTFHVVLEDGHVQVVNQLVTASAGGPEWGSFDLEIEFPKPTSAHGILIIMWQDMKDGSWVEELAVPVTFESYVPIGSDDPVPSPKLSDIDGHWAEAAITEAVELGFVNGYPDNTFQPESQVTRAEFLKMVLTAFGIQVDTPDGEANESPFEDTAGHWAQGYIYQAVRSGILDTEQYDGEFKPDQNITRLEMAIQLVRAMNEEKELASQDNMEATFPDTADLDAEVRSYIETAVELGILTGYPDGTFGPRRESTRAEAVTVIHRALAVRD